MALLMDSRDDRLPWTDWGLCQTRMMVSHLLFERVTFWVVTQRACRQAPSSTSLADLEPPKAQVGPPEQSRGHWAVDRSLQLAQVRGLDRRQLCRCPSSVSERTPTSDAVPARQASLPQPIDIIARSQGKPSSSKSRLVSAL
jgi:hypothetical protein